LGGDSKFVRGVVNIASFYNIWLDHVISGRAQGVYVVGWSKDPVPLFERLYLGGSNSLRGFKARQVSPVDETGTRVGGTIQLLGNVADTVPLFFGVRAAVFYDVGQVYGPDTSFGTTFDLGDLRHNAGLSLRWASPFGPLRVDYGIKLDRRKDESMGEFQFAVGAPF
jgi:outer membrane protein insertion porin family